MVKRDRNLSVAQRYDASGMYSQVVNSSADAVFEPKRSLFHSLVHVLVGFLPNLCFLVFTIPAIAQTQPASGAKSNNIATPPPPVSGPGHFVDVTTKAHVSFVGQASHTSKKYLLETIGSGVALFDYDNDGLLDIFFVNGAAIADPTPKGTIPQKTAPKYWNRLFHQKKDGTFEDVTEKAGLQGVGYGMGVAAADYDNDGNEDLYVTAYGGNRLYHNNGDGTFSDVTEKSGTSGSGWSTSAAWVDLDNDGLLDLVVLRYLRWDFDDIWCGEHREGYRSYCHPDIFPAVSPLVYHNEGNGRFSEVTAKMGLDKPGKGLGIAIADYDRDGKIDIVVANDSMLEFLYRNKGDGTFEEVGLTAEIAVDGDGRTYAGMGVDFQDYDNDGMPDLVITNLANQKYALYHNSGDSSFTYDSYMSGIGGMTLLHSGWGIRFLDYDNDGWLDLLAVNGHVYPGVDKSDWGTTFAQRPLLFHNLKAGKFEIIPPVKGTGLAMTLVGRGAAFGEREARPARTPGGRGEACAELLRPEPLPTILDRIGLRDHHGVGAAALLQPAPERVRAAGARRFRRS